jgi:hypothetical protein
MPAIAYGTRQQRGLKGLRRLRCRALLHLADVNRN